MADTSQTIQGFYTAAQSKDFARNNLFRVLNINFGSGSSVSFDENDLIYATTATLPGKSITNVTAPYMGLNFNVPGVVQYDGSDSYTIQFRSDESYDLRNKFLQAINDTFDDSDSTGNYFMPTEEAVLDMVLLDKELNRVDQYQLVGIYPKSVSAPSYDATTTGDIVTFDATIAYHYFRKTS